MSVEDQQDQQQKFDDALHRLVHSTGRPKEEEQKEALKQLLDELIQRCGEDSQRWKLLLLSLTQKRYHSLSPAAKEDGAKKDAVYGDGERLLFYLAMEHFVQRSVQGCADETSTALGNYLGQAICALRQLAPEAGGSRDLCHVLVSLVESWLRRDDSKLALWKTIHVSKSSLVAKGVAEWTKDKGAEKDKFVINEMLQSVACILDQDLDIVLNDGAGGTSNDALPSTMHVFIPHHDRGRKRKNQKKKSTTSRGQSENNQTTVATGPSDRLIANSLVEILLWASTGHAQSNPAFMGAYQRLMQTGSSMDTEQAKKQVFTLQTIIRKFRQKLNNFARERGHLLTDQFVLDASQLSSRQLNAGKAGDLSNLAKLAGKKQDTRVLRLIALRNESHPSKITKFGSVSEILSSISQLKHGVTGGDDIAQLERNICISRLQATTQYLRAVADKQKKRLIEGDLDRPVLSVSMENSKSDHVAAALVAAAFSTWPIIATENSINADNAKQDDPSAVDANGGRNQDVKLYLSGKEYVIDGFDSLISLLVGIDDGLKDDGAIDTFMNPTMGTATTKALMNFMDRNLSDSAMMFLVSKGDLRVPNDYMSSLIARNCGLHVHNVDDIGARLKREGAKKGDITISLAWDTVDDLDLHVFVPSGEEICYSHKTSKDGLCKLDVDMNAGVPETDNPVENVFAGNEDKQIEAPHGHYKVVVQNYAYHQKGSSSDRPVAFRVVLDKNGTKETFEGKCIKTGGSSNVTVCEFDYNGRETPFPSSDNADNATKEEKSVFNTSNMVNLTASVGQTMESLGQLVDVAYQQTHLNIARTLVNDDPVNDEDAAMDAEAEEGLAMDGDVAVTQEAPNTSSTSNSNEVRTIEANSKTLEVTSRDRLLMTLARLPKKFHIIVDQAFGGGDENTGAAGQSLVELCATDLAKRMLADRIPVQQLRMNGYPDDIIESVKAKMRVVEA